MSDARFEVKDWQPGDCPSATFRIAPEESHAARMAKRKRELMVQAAAGDTEAAIELARDHGESAPLDALAAQGNEDALVQITDERALLEVLASQGDTQAAVALAVKYDDFCPSRKCVSFEILDNSTSIGQSLGHAGFLHFVSLFTSSVRTRLSLQLGIAALRHQLTLYQLGRRRPAIRAGRPAALVDRGEVLVRLAPRLVLCPTTNSHGLASEAVSRLLASTAPAGPSGSAAHCSRVAPTHQTHVVGESCLGVTANCRRTAQAWDRSR